MKIFKKIILIVVPVVILVCFVVYWIEPEFSLWQMNKSIFIKKQELPLEMMFLPPHEDGQFKVSSQVPEFVLAGPRQTLIAGNYNFKVEIVPECSDKSLGFIDVVRKNGNMGLGAKEIVAQKSQESQTESVSFEAASGFDYEFRLYSRGTCSFRIEKIFLERQDLNWQNVQRGVWQKLKKII